MIHRLMISVCELLAKLPPTSDEFRRAVQLSGEAADLEKKLKTAKCSASLEGGILTLEDGTQIELF
jgi:hypothetical protein